MFYFDTIKSGSKDKKILKSTVMDEFQADFKHLFTTKESFIKTGDENLKNLADSNRKLVLDYLKINDENLIEIKQTHTSNISIASKTPDFIDNTDGVILYKPGSATILNFADCTPVILYDPKNKVAAGLHAGWRGTADSICKKGVKLMVENFNSKPSDIIAAIAPCIGQEAFETGIEVYEKLKGTIQNPNTTEFFRFKNDKVYPDLAKINAAQLMEAGLKTIDISHFKTCKDNEFFFSYRHENKTTNRISMVIKIV